MFSKEAIEIAEKEGTTWITRVSNTVKETSQSITHALMNEKEWHQTEDEGKVKYQEFIIDKYEEQLRFFVVQTDASVKPTEKAVTRRVDKEAVELEKSLKDLSKKNFACEEDLKLANAEVFKKVTYHSAGEGSLLLTDPNKGAGRPSTKEVKEEDKVWRLILWKYEANQKIISKKKGEDACFVIATNAPKDKLSGERIVEIYQKDQQGVERSF